MCVFVRVCVCVLVCVCVCRWEAGNAEMEVRQCTVYGKVWQTIDRPGSLSECDNRFTVSSMTQASRDVYNAHDNYHTGSQFTCFTSTCFTSKTAQILQAT